MKPATARRWLPILFILGLSLFAWAPLLTPAYFFGAHDAPHSVFFLVEFDQTLRDGYLWPRWSPDFAFGYGYPLFNIYSPLAFYAAEGLHLLGLSFVDAVKAMYALATVGAGLAMYGFVRRWLGHEAGVLGAVVYMFVPFHLVEIFVRSAYSEFVALALFPLVLWAFTELIAAPRFRNAAWAGLAYGLLALVHHTSFFTFTPFLAVCVLYWLASVWRRRGRRFVLRAGAYAAGAALLGLAAAAVYLVPMVAEMRYLKVSQWTANSYDFRQHFVYLSQLFSPAWGYGYSGPGLADDMSFQLGAVPVVLALGAAVLALAHCFLPGSRERGELARSVPHLTLFFALVTVAIVGLMTPAADALWLASSLVSLVQFPWRLLGLTALTLSVLAGALYPLGTGLARRLAQPAGGPAEESPVILPVEVCLLSLVVALAAFGYTLPQYTPVEPWRQTPQAVVRWDRFSPADRVAMLADTTQQPTTSPLEAQYMADQPLQVAAILRGTGTVETVRHGGASNEVRVVAQEPAVLQFYTYDYPGWQVSVDGQPVRHRAEPPYGLVSLDVPAGEHDVILRMGSTSSRLAGGLVSLAAWATIVVGLAGRGIWRSLFRLL